MSLLGVWHFLEEMLVLELYIVLVLPTKESLDQTGIQIHVFHLLCDFGSYMGLHLWNVSEREVNIYFFGFSFYPNPVFKFILDHQNFAPRCLRSVPFMECSDSLQVCNLQCGGSHLA